jgi:hypothetical protein
MHCCADLADLLLDVWRSSPRGGAVVASRGIRKTNAHMHD